MRSLLLTLTLISACTTSSSPTSTDDPGGKGDCPGCTEGQLRPFTLVDAKLTLRANTAEASVVTVDQLRQLVRDRYMRIVGTDLQRDTSELDRVAYCLDLVEVPGAITCVSFSQAHMNAAFTRP